jgi:hypothetical protein
MTTPKQKMEGIVDSIPCELLIPFEHDPQNYTRVFDEQVPFITPVEVGAVLLQDTPPKDLAAIARNLRAAIDSRISIEEMISNNATSIFGRTLIKAALFKVRAARLSLPRLYELEVSRESRKVDKDTYDYLERFRTVHISPLE